MAEGKTNVGIAAALVSARAPQKHITTSSASSTCPTPNDHRRVLAVLAYLDAGRSRRRRLAGRRASRAARRGGRR